jgi:hypothetical protein
MAEGFKIADAYVQVETRYDRDKLVDGLSDAFDSESSTIRRIGREKVGRPVGDGAAEGMSTAWSRHMRAQIRGQRFVFREDLIRLGDDIGKTTARGITPAMARQIRSDLKGKSWLIDALNSPEVNRDVDRGGRRLGRRFGGGFRASMLLAIPEAFVEAITLGMADLPIGAARANPALAAFGIALGVAVATALISGLTATLAAALAGGFGLGLIGLSVFILKDEPRFVAAVQRLGKRAGAVFHEAAQVMLGPIVESLDIIGDGMERNAGVIAALFATLAPVLPPLTEGLVGFLEALGPGLQALAEVAADVLLDLAEALPGMGEDLGSFFIQIRENWPEIEQSLRLFFHDLGSFLDFLADLFIWLATHYQLLRTITKGLVIPPATLLLIEVLRKAWNADWSGLISDARRHRGVFLSILFPWPSLVHAALRSLWPRVSGIFSGFRRNIIDAALDARVGFVTRIRALPGLAMNAISSLRERIRGYFSNARAWLAQAGRNIISGLIDGIRAMIPSLSGTLSWVTGMLPDWKGPPERDRQILRPSGRMLISGLQEGVKDQLPSLKLQLEGVTAGIPRVVNNAAPAPVAGATFNLHVTVHAGVGSDGTKIGREAARALHDALQQYERSVKR